MSELGKAYVQVVPSAKGIKGALSKEIGGEAGNTGKSAGLNIAGAIKGAIIAAGIGTAIKSAVMEGAQLEQSLGGVETMFKENADRVKEYANQAYKTAGMSANEYMQNVTSFSASLLQSLGGDTKAAADVANMAMVDMSDNANKFGSNMADIQHAYQGFAKQNYTMLDNLKLGYGGTKSEMERLLADAEKLSGVEYDINNLSDVYEAIHVIQEELGVTGTTAKEAAETLSGSMAMMAASFKNVLGKLSIGQDITADLQALGESVNTFLFGNLLPMFGNILIQLPTLFNGVADFLVGAINEVANMDWGVILNTGIEIVGQLCMGIVQAVPQILEAGYNLVMSLWEGIQSVDWSGVVSEMLSFFDEAVSSIAPTLTTGQTLLESVQGGITEMLPSIFSTGIEILMQLVNGILTNLPAIITAVGGIMNSFVGYISANLPTIIGAGIQLLFALVDGIITNLPSIAKSAFQAIARFIQTVLQNLPQILQSGIQLIGQLVAGMIQRIPSIVSAAAQIISSAARQFTSMNWSSIGRDIVSGVARGISGAVGIVANAAVSAAKSAYESAKNFLGINSPSRLFRYHIGNSIPEGMAKGIEDNEYLVTSAMHRLVDDLSNDSRNRIRSAVDYSVAPNRSALGRITDAINYQTNRANEQMATANFYLDKTLFAKAVAVPVGRQIDYNSKFYDMLGGVRAYG